MSMQIPEDTFSSARPHIVAVVAEICREENILPVALECPSNRPRAVSRARRKIVKRLSSEGFSLNWIAKLLGIQETTARYHLDDARRAKTIEKSKARQRERLCYALQNRETDGRIVAEVAP